MNVSQIIFSSVCPWDFCFKSQNSVYNLYGQETMIRSATFSVYLFGLLPPFLKLNSFIALILSHMESNVLVKISIHNDTTGQKNKTIYIRRHVPSHFLYLQQINEILMQCAKSVSLVDKLHFNIGNCTVCVGAWNIWLLIFGGLLWCLLELTYFSRLASDTVLLNQLYF